MNREIKFRVKEVRDGQANAEWSYFTLGDLACSNFSTDHQEFVGETWVQFTGLKDKNGVEIYEGDIVHVEVEQTIGEPAHAIGSIVWMDSAAGWSIEFASECIVIDAASEIEVIGNEHENPELLEKEAI